MGFRVARTTDCGMKELLRKVRDNKKLIVAVGSLLCSVAVLVALVFFLYKLKQRMLEDSEVSNEPPPTEDGDEPGQGR
ncbi:MAG: hypothetical protein FJ386_11865 [Verrucomicrobia bacterium]|nr:hypothetical protein [Verrucomicrobiota bacterium]